MRRYRHCCYNYVDGFVSIVVVLHRIAEGVKSQESQEEKVNEEKIRISVRD